MILLFSDISFIAVFFFCVVEGGLVLGSVFMCVSGFLFPCCLDVLAICGGSCVIYLIGEVFYVCVLICERE